MVLLYQVMLQMSLFLWFYQVTLQVSLFRWFYQVMLQVSLFWWFYQVMLQVTLVFVAVHGDAVGCRRCGGCGGDVGVQPLADFVAGRCGRGSVKRRERFSW